MKIIFYTVFVFGFLTSCGTATKEVRSNREIKSFEPIAMEYTFKNLKLNDLDQMMDLLFRKNNEYKKNELIQKLKEGALIAYSRPDEDRTLDKVISVVKNPLEDNSEWENTVEAMVNQSISKMNEEKADPAYQVTAGVVLENVIAELKPTFLKQYRSGGFETDMIERIADSHVAYSRAAKSERKLNLMRGNISPSEIAQRLLQQKQDTLNAENR